MGRSRKRVSHAKEAFYIICILVVLLVGLFSYLGPGGYLEMKRTQAELETHRARVELLRKSNEERMRTIESLRIDDEAIERYARKKGYGKKDEIIQEVPQQEPPPTSDSRPKTGAGAQKK
ncbi:MAG: septum formation initiator family protein [Acidobacteriia bacterium]|nr:septum formation initiator family protein [Terriglobia bacterium]